jgi:hypothetical protein
MRSTTLHERLALLILVLACCAPGGGVLAQSPRWIPIRLDYAAPPPDLKVGDEATTVFTFTATTDVPVLEVSLAPYEGLTILEGDHHTTFEAIAKGEHRELKVRIRLTAETGKLSLEMRTRFGKQMFGDAVLITYGKPTEPGVSD